LVHLLGRVAHRAASTVASWCAPQEAEPRSRISHSAFTGRKLAGWQRAKADATLDALGTTKSSPMSSRLPPASELPLAPATCATAFVTTWRRVCRSIHCSPLAQHATPTPSQPVRPHVAVRCYNKHRLTDEYVMAAEPPQSSCAERKDSCTARSRFLRLLACALQSARRQGPFSRGQASVSSAHFQVKP